MEMGRVKAKANLSAAIPIFSVKRKNPLPHHLGGRGHKGVLEV